jgi:hypothetical protein
MEKIGASHLVKLLEEMFQNMSSWPMVEQVRAYNLGMEKDSVKPPYFNS